MFSTVNLLFSLGQPSELSDESVVCKTNHQSQDFYHTRDK